MSRKPVGRHWPELVLAVASIIIGLTLCAGQLVDAWEPSPHGDILADWQAWMLAAVMTCGGNLWAWSHLWRFADLRNLWAVERAGASLCGIAWTAYCCFEILHSPTVVASWLLSLAVAVICWWSVADSHHSEARTRDAIGRLQ